MITVISIIMIIASMLISLVEHFIKQNYRKHDLSPAAVG